MKNQLIAQIFNDIADLLELKGENIFKIRAYRKAAQTIEGLGEDIENIIREDKLEELPGIGKDLSYKIKEIIDTGRLLQYEELKKDVPAGLFEMLKVPGLGPKTVKRFYEELKIDSLEKLEDYARKGKLRLLAGIKEKTEENIIKGIGLLKKGKERFPLYNAQIIANKFIKEISSLKGVEAISVAGSLRRCKETVRDIDILVVSSNPPLVTEKFTKVDLVQDVLACGPTKSSVIASKENIQVDLRVVEKESFGSALMYFTGSKEFNIKLRQIALKKGLKLNEYGVFRTKKDREEKINLKLSLDPIDSERVIFSLLDMSYIPPELREDRGEIELALTNKLPILVELKDIKGDLHVHSKYSDGMNTIEEIAQVAINKGYKYIGICDHSQTLKVAGGLDKEAIYKKKEDIERCNKKYKDFRILLGTEVDIDKDGELDYSDSILKEFDLVIAAIHTGFKQTKEQLTKRIIKACQNKYVHIIAHPRGRLFGVREACELNMEEILKVCRDYKVALEINSYPQRLDLDSLDANFAKKYGIKLSLGTDSHMINHFSYIDLGISIARRAWLEKEDVLNTMGLEELIAYLKK